MANFLEINHITKYFNLGKEQFPALDNIHFEVASGEFICILGPSGCGKTTLLKIIAGIEQQASGQILLEGNSIEGTGPERGMIFQEPRLFPWLTLKENVEFGIKGRYEKGHVQTIVQGLLQVVGLSNFAEAWPNQLSGGMAQRAAIARALAADPLILLLDEPFAALDAQTRTQLQTDFLNLWQSSRKTCIHVTHDIDEALILSQRIIVLHPSPGRVREIIPVPFPYPRCPDDPDFIALKKQLRDLLVFI